MKRFWLAIWGVSACVETSDPCPHGFQAVRSEDRCAPISELLPEPDAAGMDASTPFDAGPDASDIDAASDASQDSAVADAAVDAGDDASAPDASADTCSDSDVQAWAAFHQRAGVVATLLGCISQGCPDQSCPASDCVREAAGVQGCRTCTYQEALCVADACNSACGYVENDTDCRACTCEAGCVDRFEQCAQRSLTGACTDVYGRDASPDELILSGPWLVRAKSQTGFLTTGPLTPFPPADKAFAFATHQSEGFTHVTGFSRHNRTYLLQHNGLCGDHPCVARIFPVLSDGSFGRPVYMDTWTRGWDEVEVFEYNGVHYLLRYKTGQIPTEVETAGFLRIDRLEFDATQTQVTLAPVLQEPKALGSTAPWSSIETFTLANASYILRYSSGSDGSLELLRVDANATGLTLTPVSQDLSWTRGWDIVEIFESGAKPYVLTYKSGRIPLLDEPAGSVRIMSFSSTGDTMTLTPALYDSSWDSGLTQVLAYDAAAQTYLTLQNATSGAISVLALPADSATWQSDLRVQSAAWNAQWGANPVWDMLAILPGTESSP